MRMIIPDANLIIFAHNSSSPYHLAAREWWEGVLNGTRPVGIPWVVVLAFVRLSTHPTINQNPMTVTQAQKAVETWLAQPQVRLIGSTEKTLPMFFDNLKSAGSGGNLSTDALIAALAAEHGGTVYSTDRDFDRFNNITVENPLA